MRPTVTIQTHYTITADPSIVDLRTNYNDNATRTNYYSIPNEFTINNLRIASETPRTGYTGKFEFIMKPSSDVVSANKITITFNNHVWNGGVWTTPTNALTDALVCMINYIRVDCTFTLAPLTITMNVSPAGIVMNQENLFTFDT